MKSTLLKDIARRLLALGLTLAIGVTSSVCISTPAYAAEPDPVSSAVWAATGTGLQGIGYLSSTKIADLLAPAQYTTAEKADKQKEILNRGGITFNEITDAMVVKDLRQDNLQIISYGPAFDSVKENLEETLPHIIRNSPVPDGSDPVSYFTGTINNNQEELLLGLAYLYRFYDFEIGGINIKDTLLQNPSYFGMTPDLLTWLIDIGGSGNGMLSPDKNLTLFSNLFTGRVTEKTSLTDFLEAEIEKSGSGTADAWFLNTSRAIIVEQGSAANPSAQTSLYSRLKSDARLSSFILPLLNVSQHSVYVISNAAGITLGLVDAYADRSLKTSDPTAYAQELSAFRSELERTAKAQAAFLDLWYRLAKEEDKADLSANRLMLDTLRVKSGSNGSASNEWSAKFGDDASIGVREFIAPLKLYANFTQANAQAEGTGVRFFISKAASDDGLCTYTHELTHLLEESVFMNNHKAREGLDAEFYPRGLYETYHSTDSVMNLNFIYDLSQTANRVYNKTPERFQTADDLQQFTQGMLDVIYTLDYLEAEAVLQKDASAKQTWFHKFEQVADTDTRYNHGNSSATHTNDSIRALTPEEAAALRTLDDLIEHNIVASRYEIDGLKTTGSAASNGCYTIPLFTANYSSSANSNGVSGDITTRRQAYEMLAEYGYYGGMVPYISNQYLPDAKAEGEVLSDTYIFGKLFGAEYSSIAAFKKAMFQRRVDRLAELTPVTITYGGKMFGSPPRMISAR